MTLRRAIVRIGVVAGLVAALLVAGAVNGVGPLARVPPPSEVSDPREMLARSLQALIDASSVHVEASLRGQVPGSLVGRQDPTVPVEGTAVSLDLRPQDARSHLLLGSPTLGIGLEAITSWDTMAYRRAAGPWVTGSLGSVVAGTGIDADPLTLVGRVRTWLAQPGAPTPVATDVRCDAASGTCRRVSVSLGRSAGDALLAAIAGSGGASVGATSTDLVLETDVATLRPAHLVVTTRNADGSLALTLRVDCSAWDAPSVIADPPSG